MLEPRKFINHRDDLSPSHHFCCGETGEMMFQLRLFPSLWHLCSLPRRSCGKALQPRNPGWETGHHGPVFAAADSRNSLSVLWWIWTVGNRPICRVGAPGVRTALPKNDAEGMAASRNCWTQRPFGVAIYCGYPRNRVWRVLLDHHVGSMVFTDTPIRRSLLCDNCGGVRVPHNSVLSW